MFLMNKMKKKKLKLKNNKQKFKKKKINSQKRRLKNKKVYFGEFLIF